MQKIDDDTHTIQDICRMMLDLSGPQDLWFYPAKLSKDLTNCEHCGAPYSIAKLINSTNYEDCVCHHCQWCLISGVWFCFPEGTENQYMSIANSQQQLEMVESKRE